jgi:serine/threonine protein kinase
MNPAQAFSLDIFCLPPSHRTYELCVALYNLPETPVRTKALLSQYMRHIAKPLLLLEPPPFADMIQQVDGTSKHLVQGEGGQLQWETIYRLSGDASCLVVRDTIKSAQYGKIARGYMVALDPNTMTMAVGEEVCVKVSSLRLSELGTSHQQPGERIFESAIKELECLRLLSKFHHPNLIPLLNHGVLEKARGEKFLMCVFPLAWYNLHDAHVMGEVTLATIHQIRVQIGSALQCLHALGFAHRDVSLENMVESRERGRFLLIDFGLAKKLRLEEDGKWAKEPVETDAAGRRYLVGKMRYIPPEFFLQTGVFDLVKADLFSFGVALFFLCTERFPYHYRSETAPESPGEWTAVYSDLPDDFFVQVCARNALMAWLGGLLWLSPSNRVGVGAILFPLV